MHIDVVSKALSKLVHWSYMLLIRPASQEFPRNPGESNSVSSEAQLEARNPNRPMKGCRMLLAFRIIQYSAILRSMADLAIQLLNSHALPSQNCLVKLVWLIISPNEKGHERAQGPSPENESAKLPAARAPVVELLGVKNCANCPLLLRQAIFVAFRSGRC